jgi:hypothetical protein
MPSGFDAVEFAESDEVTFKSHGREVEDQRVGLSGAPVLEGAPVVGARVVVILTEEGRQRFGVLLLPP